MALLRKATVDHNNGRREMTLFHITDTRNYQSTAFEDESKLVAKEKEAWSVELPYGASTGDLYVFTKPELAEAFYEKHFAKLNGKELEVS